MSESELSNMFYVVQTQIKDLSMRQQKLFTQVDDDDVFYLFLQKQNMLRTVCKSKQIQKPDQNFKRKKLESKKRQKEYDEAEQMYQNNKEKLETLKEQQRGLQKQLSKKQRKRTKTEGPKTQEEPAWRLWSSEKAAQSRIEAEKKVQDNERKREAHVQQKINALKQRDEFEKAKQVNKYNPQHLKHLDKDLQFFKQLVNFCKDLAVQSKAVLYAVMQQHVRSGDMEPDLWKLGTSAVALSQNNGIPITPHAPQKISHQIIRSFLHMHDVSLQAVIYAFLRYYYGLISECEAFTALIYAIRHLVKIGQMFSARLLPPPACSERTWRRQIWIGGSSQGW
jgi:hypothetical protein